MGERCELSIDRQRRLLLAVILGFLALLKLELNSRVTVLGLDGAVYANAAKYVRDGQGLLSDASLFNAGFSYFPHPTTLYPLWPLALGWISRLVPLSLAGIWLPTCCYFGTLLLGYGLAVRLLPGPLFPGTWPAFDAGHLLVLMLGMNLHFFNYTSRPFTEGPAFLVLFVTLWRAEALFGRPGWLRGLEVGLWLGALVLIRSQLILVALAVGAALGWGVIGVSRRYVGPALACAAGLAGVLAVQLLHLRSFDPAAGLGLIMRFDQYQESSALPRLTVMVQQPGVREWLKDRAGGVPLAFSRYSDRSYFVHFYTFCYALPLAIPFLAVDALRGLRRKLGRLPGGEVVGEERTVQERPGLRSAPLDVGREEAARGGTVQERPSLRSAPLDVGREEAARGGTVWQWLRDPGHLFALSLVLLAAAGFLSIHTLHKALFTPWNFGLRHALTAFFAFYAAMIYLCRRPYLGRVCALVLLGSSLFLGYVKLEGNARKAHEFESYSGKVAFPGLVEWLEARQHENPTLRVAMPDIRLQMALQHTYGIGYQWYFAGTRWEDLLTLFQGLKTHYLILPRGERFEFLRDRRRFEEAFRLEASDLSGFDVYEPR